MLLEIYYIPVKTERRMPMTNFKRYQKFSGIKQVQLAKLAEFSPVTISQMEKKAATTSERPAKYAKLLNCNTLLLLDGLS